jgi:hypothetical protein
MGRAVGSTTLPVIADLRARLQRAGFPKVPPNALVPGTPGRSLFVKNGPNGVRVEPIVVDASAVPGYAEFLLLDSIVVAVTDGFIPLLAQPLQGVGTQRC